MKYKEKYAVELMRYSEVEAFKEDEEEEKETEEVVVKEMDEVVVMDEAVELRSKRQYKRPSFYCILLCFLASELSVFLDSNFLFSPFSIFCYVANTFSDAD